MLVFKILLFYSFILKLLINLADDFMWLILQTWISFSLHPSKKNLKLFNKIQKFRLGFTYPSIFSTLSPCPEFKWTMIQRTNILLYNLNYKTEDPGHGGATAI